MSNSRPHSPRWPLGLLGTIGLLIAVESFLARNEEVDFSTVWATGWRYSKRRANHTAGYDLLCIGDSLVKFGVVPKVLEQELGLRTTNLAMCVGQPPAAFSVLKRSLRSGARPKAIVVDFTEHLLSSGPRKNLRHWPELLTSAECAELAWTAGDKVFFAQLMLGKLVPSIKDRGEIRAGTLAALQGKRTEDRDAIGAFLRNWSVNDGAQPISKLSQLAPSDAWFKDVYPSHWKCHPVNAIYIERFLELASSHQIKVFWLLPPYRHAFQELCEKNGVDHDFERGIRRVLSRFPSVVVLDGRKAAYPDSVYGGDPIHLDFEGATAFTEDVAVMIKECLTKKRSESRWLAMPDYRERPRHPSVEDLNQSRMIAAGVALPPRR
jgi:hypothetical protein